MGWFDSQIREKNEYDDKVFSEAMAKMASAVLGNSDYIRYMDDDVCSQKEIGKLLRYYHINPVPIPDYIEDNGEKLEYVMRICGVMYRTIKLTPGFSSNSMGPILAKRSDNGSIVALIPSFGGKYTFLDNVTGETVRLDKKKEELFLDEAICFYKPFPTKALTKIDLVKYIFSNLDISDCLYLGFIMLVSTALGFLSPIASRALFAMLSNQTANYMSITSLIIFMTCTMLSLQMIGVVKMMMFNRIQAKISVPVEAASMMRLLSLPVSFHRKFSSGELASYNSYICSLCSMISNSVLSIGLTSIFSLAYIGQIFAFAPGLVIPSLCIIAANVVFTLISVFASMRINKERMMLQSKENGMTYALLNGIQKIKLAGAQKRAFARWADLFTQITKVNYDPPIIVKYSSVFSLAISAVGTLVLYYCTIISGVNVADYYAFTMSYSMLSGAFMSLIGIAGTLAQFKPVLDIVKPLLDAVPEMTEEKQIVNRVSGEIEVNHVSFKYDEDSPNIIDDLSIKIAAGEYVAIVGETGCGKSTLLRILLGFEKPQKGTVFYDNYDLNSIDMRSLRRKMGIVLQNSALFMGDIFSNIAISNPSLTLDEAWEAAKVAGIDEDIHKMPMGMNTMISEGNGGISGGQKQRLMIARAVAGKPKIVMFDEATSALDNVTQRKISDAMDDMKCTRIVIAHRLSTIKNCDKIIVLKEGRICEQGNYSELIALGGYFADLVKHQRLESGA